MGHNQWNINSKEGIEIAHSTIIEILREKKKAILLSELVTLLNSRTKKYKIHPNKNKNTFSKYLKSNHGGILQFLDDYNIYGIINSKATIQVVLLEEYLEKNNSSPLKRITKDNEWIFV